MVRWEQLKRRHSSRKESCRDKAHYQSKYEKSSILQLHVLGENSPIFSENLRVTQEPVQNLQARKENKWTKKNLVPRSCYQRSSPSITLEALATALMILEAWDVAVAMALAALATVDSAGLLRSLNRRYGSSGFHWKMLSITGSICHSEQTTYSYFFLFLSQCQAYY